MGTVTYLSGHYFLSIVFLFEHQRDCFCPALPSSGQRYQQSLQGIRKHGRKVQESRGLRDCCFCDKGTEARRLYSLKKKEKAKIHTPRYLLEVEL